MDEKTQDECKRLIKKYQGYKSERHKVVVRNKLFETMLPHMKIWVQSILKKFGKWEPEEEILSLSWDCFYFCLCKHDGSNIPVPKYFHDFSKYHLLMYYAKKESVNISLEELSTTLLLGSDSIDENFNKWISLCQFAEIIPNGHWDVFSDAIQSVCPRDSERVWGWKSGCGISRETYRQLKRIYKNVIRWIYFGKTGVVKKKTL